MDYQKRKTAAKVAVPATVLFFGPQVVQWIGSHIGFDIDDNTSYNVVTGIFSAVAGIRNWWKNRKKKSY